MATKAPKKGARKKKKVDSPKGSVYIQCTSNNTIISITDKSGNVLAWGSAGLEGFKGSRKSTPYAAQLAAHTAGQKAFDMGLKEIDIYMKGIGGGRESALRSLKQVGFHIKTIADVTPIPHNGCRAKKPRRM